ncbi:unnamed protein product [Rotaria sordida]|uniref:G-protein coupled receptors family 1 profile domain-containing protein n=1 Tax=Rotaria sordida TaxID=392033 RepID=A0A819KGC1_9BILA|nr:unnamed protein product [Rotaria sordida]
MSMTTTPILSNRNTTTTTFPQEQLFLFFQDPIAVIRIYQIGYLFTFLLGFPGNIASLFTFSQPTLRKVSTGCLFITLAISDILYLFMCIFDFLEFGLKIRFYSHVAYDELCRFRSFIMNVTQILSAWILVIVSIDRWIRTRFPFKSNSICTPKKALIAVGVLLVIDIVLHVHMLTPMFGTLIPGFSIAACGPTITSISYFLFYFLNWSIVQILTTCLIPVAIMLTILIDIFIIVRARKQAVIQPVQFACNNRNIKQQNTLQKHIFILMFGSICIFLITSLPLAIYKILSPRQAFVSFNVFQIISIWAYLKWFQSLFYAVSFYIHCLSSTFFRKEFKAKIKRIFNIRQTPVTVMQYATTLQHIRLHETRTKY